MLTFGWGEILLVTVVIIVVVGPKDLPKLNVSADKGKILAVFFIANNKLVLGWYFMRGQEL